MWGACQLGEMSDLGSLAPWGAWRFGKPDDLGSLATWEACQLGGRPFNSFPFLAAL